MDLEGIEGLNEVRPVVYRAALKLRSLQKLCQMHLVFFRDLRPVLRAVGGSGDPTVSLSQQNLRQSLEQLFHGVLQELPEQAVSEATEQTTRLLFKLYDREETGFVLLRSVEAALVVLSGDTLSAKHRALFQLAVSCSARQGTESSSVSHGGLRVLLNDLSQVPAVVQENHVFGHTETAVRSCFNGVISASVGEEHFVSWLQSEPRLLLWLSTLYRLSVSEAVLHRVRCHACKAFPISGLRYRCLKCLNVHLCQNCFLTETRTRKHKPYHPVLEYCTQPSWKESMASLASSARHALLPRRYTRREVERRALRARSDIEPQHSTYFPVQPQQQCASDPGGLPPPPPPPPSDSPPLQMKVESKALQTDEPDAQPQRKTSLLQKDLSITQKAMRDLQRDKWLLEREFQVWKVAAQSEHDSLEDRCAELETTMDALNHHNRQLEEELEQIRHALSMRGRCEFGSPDIQQLPPSPPSQQHNGDDTSEKQRTASESTDSHRGSVAEEGEPEREEEEEKEERMWEKKEEEDAALHQMQEEAHMGLNVMEGLVTQAKEEVQLVGEPEEEALEEAEEPELERVELITESPPSYGSAQEDSGTENSDEEEEELCDLVQRLKGALLLAAPTGSSAHQREALLQAAGAVGDSVSHLVTSVRSFT
ncbi:LOW QUALITY PROTEIN: dystrotelin [Colossoma macropomum]|uniref:LOW QUALITY PROTEIN: dystrotelin n=1 Tax=Colossoma macropomum TaxID=42526 RepID=UPI0018653F07|nr:LOW QUALITY PROTEIN: dystrotelin [Colossoma macropomum]